MKVNYTLPGYRPETEVSKDLVESFDAPFKNRMQAFGQQPSVGWKELLGLNAAPPDLSQVPEPHADASGFAGAAAVRQQWREFLTRHGGIEERENSAEPVRRMLDLLDSYQKESDALFSRGVSEAQR